MVARRPMALPVRTRARPCHHMEAAIGGRERSGPVSLPLSRSPCRAIPPGRVLVSLYEWAWWYLSMRLGGELGHCWCLPALLPHSIPHARALNTCPGGAPPNYRQHPKRKTPYILQTVLYYCTMFMCCLDTTPSLHSQEIRSVSSMLGAGAGALYVCRQAGCSLWLTANSDQLNQ